MHTQKEYHKLFPEPQNAGTGIDSIFRGTWGPVHLSLGKTFTAKDLFTRLRTYSREESAARPIDTEWRFRRKPPFIQCASSHSKTIRSDAAQCFIHAILPPAGNRSPFTWAPVAAGSGGLWGRRHAGEYLRGAGWAGGGLWHQAGVDKSSTWH